LKLNWAQMGIIGDWNSENMTCFKVDICSCKIRDAEELSEEQSLDNMVTTFGLDVDVMSIYCACAE